MATHLRAQIRAAIVATLAGLPTTGARVFASRVYPLERADLPGLLVFVRGEASAATTLPAPRVMQRTLRIQVVAVARGNANVDATLDQICLEVETQLAMPCAALAGLAKHITLSATEIDVSGETEKPIGNAAMSYDVEYIAAENTPTMAN
jgi:hypothetical protein